MTLTIKKKDRRVVDFQRKVYASLRSTNRKQLRDILQGLHSGIPICCIAFFITTYLDRFQSGRAGNDKDWRWVGRHVNRNHAVARSVGRKIPGYVPCPACVRAKRFVHVHMCTLRCKNEIGSKWA